LKQDGEAIEVALHCIQRSQICGVSTEHKIDANSAFNKSSEGLDMNKEENSLKRDKVDRWDLISRNPTRE